MIKFKDELEWYDGPIMFTAEDENGNLYFCNWCDEVENDWIYFCIPISKEKLEKVLKKEIDLRRLYKEETNLYKCVFINYKDCVNELIPITEDEAIAGNWYCDEGCFL